MRVVVLGSKADHGLRELLQRQHDGELAVDIPCVISNHENLGPLTLAHGVPFHRMPMPTCSGPGATRDAAFERVFDLFAQHRGDVMVLGARRPGCSEGPRAGTVPRPQAAIGTRKSRLMPTPRSPTRSRNCVR